MIPGMVKRLLSMSSSLLGEDPACASEDLTSLDGPSPEFQ